MLAAPEYVLVDGTMHFVDTFILETQNAKSKFSVNTLSLVRVVASSKFDLLLQILSVAGKRTRKCTVAFLRNLAVNS